MTLQPLQPFIGSQLHLFQHRILIVEVLLAQKRMGIEIVDHHQQQRQDQHDEERAHQFIEGFILFEVRFQIPFHSGTPIIRKLCFHFLNIVVSYHIFSRMGMLESRFHKN